MFGRQQSTEVAFVFPTQLSLDLNMTAEFAEVIVSALRKGKSELIQLMYIFLSDMPSNSTFQQQINLRPCDPPYSSKDFPEEKPKKTFFVFD